MCPPCSGGRCDDLMCNTRLNLPFCHASILFVSGIVMCECCSAYVTSGLKIASNIFNLKAVVISVWHQKWCSLLNYLVACASFDVMCLCCDAFSLIITPKYLNDSVCLTGRGLSGVWSLYVGGSVMGGGGTFMAR